MIALQLLLTYIPLMNRMFDTAPIGVLSWALILLASVSICALIEFEKWVGLRLSTRTSDQKNGCETFSPT
jgi:cation-transporting P-type ATPase F